MEARQRNGERVTRTKEMLVCFAWAAENKNSKIDVLPANDLIYRNAFGRRSHLHMSPFYSLSHELSLSLSQSNSQFRSVEANFVNGEHIQRTHHTFAMKLRERTHARARNYENSKIIFFFLIALLHAHKRSHTGYYVIANRKWCWEQEKNNASNKSRKCVCVCLNVQCAFTDSCVSMRRASLRIY